MAKKGISAGADFESWVRNAFKRIGFKVAGGTDLRVGGHQIDCCAGWDDVLLVVECTQSGRDDASIRKRISEVRGKQGRIKAGFKRLEGYEIYTRFVFAIATNIPITDSDRDLAKQRPPVHLIDEQWLTYYEDLQGTIDRGALFNLLGELEVEPLDLEFPRMPAFQLVLDKYGPAYLFWCDPHELLKIAYVARRESGRTLYYQRLLAKKRLGDVRKYINRGGVFPNNVILAFDSKPTFRPKAPYEEGFPGWLTFGELRFPRSYRSAWVIDGQHRLYAFGWGDPNPKGQKLAVLAFEQMNLSDQAKFFIDINHEQKPVSQDLILDLEGDLRPETERGQIANCIKELNRLDPLQNAVYLPLSGERRRGQLKISGLFIDLRETGLLRDRTHNMTQGQRNPLAVGADNERGPKRAAAPIASFLSQVAIEAQEDHWKSVFMTPGGMTLAVHVYERVLVRFPNKPSQQDVKKYTKAFVDAVSALIASAGGIRELQRDLTSYAQRREVLKAVLRLMRDGLGDKTFAHDVTHAEDPWLENIATFERRLAQFVSDTLRINTIADLKQWAPEAVWKRSLELTQKEQRVNPNYEPHQALTLGDVRQIIERKAAGEIIMPKLIRDRDGFASREEVLAALGHVARARSAPAHGHQPRGNRPLVESYLATFRAAVG